MKRRRKRNQPKAPTLSATLPDDLIAEVLSFLDVKSLLKLRCVCKFWKSLISDPKFVQLHLKRSQRNPHFALYTREWESNEWESLVTFPIRCLLDNPLNTLPDEPRYRLIDIDLESIVDSCNGLICLHGNSLPAEDDSWFCFWNPATRKVSEKLGFYRHYIDSGVYFRYMFGYDKSSYTYKLVTLHLVMASPSVTVVKVFSLSDNVWRVIDSLPLLPMLPLVPGGSYGADFHGSLNWLALRTDIGTSCIDVWENYSVEQIVISSLDLATETCTQLMPPPSFDEVPHIHPHICVLEDCLCFSHDVKGTHLVIWKMTELGVQESWTQFLKISYQNLDIDYDFGNLENRYDCRWTPLHISRNDDIVIFSKNHKDAEDEDLEDAEDYDDVEDHEDAAIIYNWRDNRVTKTRFTQEIRWLYSRNYVESLVSPC